MISDNLKEKIADAMKAKDTLRVSTLRMLSSELHNMEIEKRGKLSEDDEISVVQREIKKRKDAIEAYQKAKATEREDEEKKELEILFEFLPEQLSEKEIDTLLDEAVKKTNASQIQDMGKVIGFVMGKAKGKVDGSLVAAKAKEKLGQND